MRWLEAGVARITSLLRGRSAELRADEEFRFHVDMQTAKNVALGYTPDEARRRALLEFGGVDRHREMMRDERRPRHLSELVQDIRFTTRSLRHSPGFAVTAVLVIALGVGATTALFSLANAFLFRPLPVTAPAELYGVQEVRQGSMSRGPEGNRIPYPRYVSYRDAATDLFTGLAAFSLQGFSLRTELGAVQVAGVETSGNYFDVLGIRPSLGRFYQRDDEPYVVLSHRFWQTQYGGNPDVIGRALHVDGRAYTVAGVAPRGFDGTITGFASALWVPVNAHASADGSETDRWVGMFGRMRDGVGADGATAALSTIATRIPTEDAGTTVERAYLTRFTGLPDSERGSVMGFMGMLLAAGFLVLMIAAANIAALLLARAVARRREVAVRLALGAGRFRLVRQLLTESTAIFLLGGVGGVAIAYAATALLARISVPGIPIVIEATPDLSVLAFALTVAGVTGLVFGLAPALRATRPDLTGTLRDGAASGATSRARGRSVFVSAQIAFAMVLLIAAGLFVRGLQRGLSVDPGFIAEGVTVGTVNVEPHSLTEEQGRVFFDDLLLRVRSIPGIEAASLAQVILLTGNQHSGNVSSVDVDPVTLSAMYNVVDTAYFRTLGIELTAGRGFTAADHSGSVRVAVVNETLAARLWPGRNPVGQRMTRGGEYEVIGVVRDGRYVSLDETTPPFVFYAAQQLYSPKMSLHVRARGEPAQLIRSIRAELREVHPDIALEMPMTLPQMIGFNVIPHRFAAGLIGLFGVLGLALAGAGIYGVMAYQVAQRTREFGIRVALGAPPRQLVKLVLGSGAVIAAAGAAAGIVLAAAVTRLLSSLLFGLDPLDPVTFAAVAATLGVVALLASWLPARRAGRVDPIVSLRAE